VYKSDEDWRWIVDHAEIQRIADTIEQRRIELGKTSFQVLIRTGQLLADIAERQGYDVEQIDTIISTNVLISVK
jgi:hypothetical protein